MLVFNVQYLSDKLYKLTEENQKYEFYFDYFDDQLYSMYTKNKEIVFYFDYICGDLNKMYTSSFNNLQLYFNKYSGEIDTIVSSDNTYKFKCMYMGSELYKITQI